MKFCMMIGEEEAGAVIGKNGEKIREIREMAGVSLVVHKKKGGLGRLRMVRIEGSQRNVAFAKHLVNIRLKLHAVAIQESIGKDEGEKTTQELQAVQTAATQLARCSNV